jgi:uncharacterized membrane protein YfcA
VLELDSGFWNAALAVLSGGVVGLSLGATGGGGALLAVPLLVYVLGTPVQAAAGMSLILVGVSAWIGVWQHTRAGAVKLKAAFVFSSTGMVGAWIGAQGHRLVRDELVLVLFGLLMLIISACMLWTSNVASDNQDQISCADEFPRSCVLKVTGLGLGVGMLTGFFGVGGGFVIVPSLVLVLGFPMRAAVGTSLLIIALISIGGIVGHFQVGNLDTQLMAFLILGSAMGMVLGIHVAKKVSSHTLTRLFAFIAIAIAFSLILDNLSHVVYQYVELSKMEDRG